MYEIETARILIPLLIPLLTAIAVLVTDRWPNVRESFSTAGAVLTFVFVMSLAPTVIGGGVYTLSLFELLPGASINLRVDGMSLLFAGVDKNDPRVQAFLTRGESPPVTK